MKALCWHGKHDIRYETVPDPVIEHPRDAIIKTTCCAICGSDLHFYDGFVPGMKSLKSWPKVWSVIDGFAESLKSKPMVAV